MHLPPAPAVLLSFPLGPLFPSSCPGLMPFVLNLKGGVLCFLLLSLPVTTF